MKIGYSQIRVERLTPLRFFVCSLKNLPTLYCWLEVRSVRTRVRRFFFIFCRAVPAIPTCCFQENFCCKLSFIYYFVEYKSLNLNIQRVFLTQSSAPPKLDTEAEHFIFETVMHSDSSLMRHPARSQTKRNELLVNRYRLDDVRPNENYWWR